jgi:AcrR family transcriptional regulator
LAEGIERYTPGLVWTRSHPTARGARPKLDRDTIVLAAIELLDREGLAALSMRQLGSHLNVGATTLYWHVANKEELLDLAFDEVMSELPDPARGVEWRDQVTRLLTQLRAMMVRHPWYARLYGSRPAFGPHAMRFNANLLGVLKQAGFEGALLDHALAALSHYVIGAITNELNWDTWRNLPPAQLQAMMSYIGDAVDAYPEYALYLKGYLMTADPDAVLNDRFMTALQSLLDGLAIRLEAK